MAYVNYEELLVGPSEEFICRPRPSNTTILHTRLQNLNESGEELGLKVTKLVHWSRSDEVVVDLIEKNEVYLNRIRAARDHFVFHCREAGLKEYKVRNQFRVRVDTKPALLESTSRRTSINPAAARKATRSLMR